MRSKASKNNTHGNKMNFGQAIESLKSGNKVSRSGWNGKGMWLVLVSGSNIELSPDTPYHNALTNNGADMLKEGSVFEILPHIDMWTINSNGRKAFLPGWVASQSDMLSEDWEIV